MKWGPVERIYGREGRHPTCYLTRISLTPKTPWGQLLLHIFHRGDEDPDPHDHPWDFWTLPLKAYYEEVWRRNWSQAPVRGVGRGEWYCRRSYVHAFKAVYRRSTHTHRVLYPASDKDGMPIDAYVEAARPRWAGWPIVTLVWARRARREWGFWVPDHVSPDRSGGRVFMPWRMYVYGESREGQVGKG